MAERYTTVRPRLRSTPIVAGISHHGRKSRREMLSAFRDFYSARLQEATAALRLSDDEIVVETHLNCVCPKNVQEVR